jgi:hypothetical protein
LNAILPQPFGNGSLALRDFAVRPLEAPVAPIGLD